MDLLNRPRSNLRWLRNRLSPSFAHCEGATMTLNTLMVLAACVVGPLASAPPAKRKIDTRVDGDNVRVLLEIFRAVETRDDVRFREHCDPRFEIHWPPSLQRRYNGRTWTDTW